MGIKLNTPIEDAYGNSAEYIVVSYANFEIISQTGSIVLILAKNRTKYLAGKRNVAQCSLMIGPAEIKDADNCVICLAWGDLNKTLNSIQTVLRTKKIKFQGYAPGQDLIVDLTLSTEE